jgi:hypothetical protein
MAGVIDDAGSLRDHVGDPLERPDLGAVAAGPCSLEEHGVDGGELLIAELGMLPPDALGELQRLATAPLPESEPQVAACRLTPS